ncbi:sigma-70 family RNA polymerase sigma factor [Hymenobacter sp. BT507]|uniref:Sigma-70 family RNA polymerase sigma factor n=2 Tax=Hymenobacter citatus TaxID=2763506 RepID=A0ABR7MR26_9BACT|nr:sigma-70 family RNA polymerase sigma factor [Hymenobacter citatus]
MAVEATLIQRLYQRDETAMLLFYNQYGAMLYGVILRIVKHTHLAESILQESMLKIWHSFPSYHPTQGRLATWALTICRNKAIDELRTQRARGAEHTTLPLGTLPTALQPHAATVRPEHVAIRELMHDLSPAAQALLDLLYFQGYTQQEAAEALGEPLSTVKFRARAAISVLARRLRSTG